MSTVHPSGFHIDIKRCGLLTYQLTTSQILTVTRETAFKFFEDPGNLCDITPLWLDFCMINKESTIEVGENAEFDYTIKFLGKKMRWQSRIIDYHPPERFTDIQLTGPYKSWIHKHILEKVPDGTLMKDEVFYTLHLPTAVLHPLIIKKKLMDIFSYRAVKIAEWTEKM